MTCRLVNLTLPNTQVERVSRIGQRAPQSQDLSALQVVLFDSPYRLAELAGALFQRVGCAVCVSMIFEAKRRRACWWSFRVCGYRTNGFPHRQIRNALRFCGRQQWHRFGEAHVCLRSPRCNRAVRGEPRLPVAVFNMQLRLIQEATGFKRVMHCRLRMAFCCGRRGVDLLGQAGQGLGVTRDRDVGDRRLIGRRQGGTITMFAFRFAGGLLATGPSSCPGAFVLAVSAFLRCDMAVPHCAATGGRPSTRRSSETGHARRPQILIGLMGPFSRHAQTRRVCGSRFR